MPQFSVLPPEEAAKLSAKASGGKGVDLKPYLDYVANVPLDTWIKVEPDASEGETVGIVRRRLNSVKRETGKTINTKLDKDKTVVFFRVVDATQAAPSAPTRSRGGQPAAAATEEQEAA